MRDTRVLGPFAGPGATLHPDNTSPTIAFSGTDLGWSYEHQGELKLLFGDTQARVDSATGTADPIDPHAGSNPYQYDDGFGSVDLGAYSDPAAFPASGHPGFPLVSLAQHPGEEHAKALNPGHWMDAFKTPFGGWSNGSDEYAVFFTFKPQACRNDASCDDHLTDLTCDTGLGYRGEKPGEERGFTNICVDGAPNCVAATLTHGPGQPAADSGLCVDRTSVLYRDDPRGRVLGVGHKLRIGIRHRADERRYDDIVEWLTSKFKNVTVATVQDFLPARGSGARNQDYSVAGDSGNQRRVFLWGRPGYVGVGAAGRSLGLYFAYVDMPAGGGFGWKVSYYTGTTDGGPRFSMDENDAAALDLDADTPGIQTREVHDNAFLQSIVWVDALEKWVMFYGGGVSTTPAAEFQSCGAVELLVGREACDQVDLGNSAIHMRTADDPWGPWSPPQDVLDPGDPNASPPTGQYASGGILYHPDCTGVGCASHYDHPVADRKRFVGLLYAPVIHVPWIDPVGDGVDLLWSVSTANPYGIVLARTRIEAENRR